MMPRLPRRLARNIFPIFLSIIIIAVLYYTWTVGHPSSSPFGTVPSLLAAGRGGGLLHGGGPDAPIRHVPSSFNWPALPQVNPVAELAHPPPGAPRDLPRVQFAFGERERKGNGESEGLAEGEGGRRMEERRAAVRELFIKGWSSYTGRALGMDEVGPVSGRGKTTLGGWAATLVDGLDTLWVMGLRAEFRRAARLACALDFGRSVAGATAANVFETTIRHLGGLLAAYDISGGTEPALLAKAVEVGSMILAAFDTPNRMPVFWLQLGDAQALMRNQKPKRPQLAGGREASAAGASLALEMTRLSQLTGDDRFYDAAERVRRLLARWQAKNETWVPGLWPVHVNWRDETAQEQRFSIGAEADSLYEYLPKMYALLGGLDEGYAAMSVAALDAARDRLIFRPMVPPEVADGGGGANWGGGGGGGVVDVLFSGAMAVTIRDGSLIRTRLEPEVQHLGCFAGGMYALAGRLLSRPDYVQVGAGLARGCAWAYGATPSGIMPETAHLVTCAHFTERTFNPVGEELDLRAPCAWDRDRWSSTTSASRGRLPPGYASVRDPRYLLRPEAIESLFYLWRITGEEEYRERAWVMFQAVRAATGARYGSGSVEDVMVKGGKVLDSMESFWFSETLKYFYLIFAPTDLLSLDEWVFNTEAHPLRRPGGGDRSARIMND